MKMLPPGATDCMTDRCFLSRLGVERALPRRMKALAPLELDAGDFIVALERREGAFDVLYGEVVFGGDARAPLGAHVFARCHDRNTPQGKLRSVPASALMAVISRETYERFEEAGFPQRPRQVHSMLGLSQQ